MKLKSQQLREEAAQLQQQAEAVKNKAGEEQRALSADESAQLEDLLNQVDERLAEAGRAELDERMSRNREALNASQGRRALPQPGPVAAPSPAYGSGARATHNSTLDERAWGFSHRGEFFSSVRNAGIGRPVDERLVHNAATTYGSEGVGPDGGYAIPPDYRANIEMLVNSENSLLGMTDQQQTSSNQLIVPVDENAPWHSAGVRAYWAAEANSATQTKPNLQPLTVTAHKIMALVYLTDELLDDAPSMGNYVNSKAPSAINWTITNALINGDGAGKPLGVLVAPAKVTVSKESSQTAATVVARNILKMWARLTPESQARAVWLYNVDTLPELAQMNIAFRDAVGQNAIAAGRDVFMPPSGLAGATYATLMGRPMYPTEACQTLGTEGDLILWDPRAYLTVVKRGGVRSDVSIHVEFEKDMTAFRFIMRIGGQPWHSKAVARANGSNTLSSIVTLQTR